MGMDGCRHSFTWTSTTTGPQTPPENYMTWCGACGTWGRWMAGQWVAQTPSQGALAMEEAERFGDALSRIYAVLGPASPKCEGCAAEIAEALNIIKAAHGV